MKEKLKNRIRKKTPNTKKLNEKKALRRLLVERVLEINPKDRHPNLTVFDYLSISDISKEQRQEMMRRFVESGREYWDDFTEFLLKKENYIDDYLGLGEEYWLSKDGVNVLKSCMERDSDKTNMMLDKLIKSVDRGNHKYFNGLVSLENMLNIWNEKREIPELEEEEELPEDSFQARLNLYLEKYLLSSSSFNINNPPEDFSKVKEWVVLAEELRIKEDVLQQVINAFHEKDGFYGKYRDMIDFADGMKDLEDEEKEILVWMKSLKIDMPSEKKIIEDLWVHIEKHIPSVSQMDFDIATKKDILVLSTLVILNAINDSRQFSILSLLLERGGPSLEKITDPETYKVQKNVEDFTKLFKKFGYEGEGDEIGTAYGLFMALKRLDKRGWNAEVKIDGSGIRVQDPFGTLAEEKASKKGKKDGVKPKDVPEEYFLSWEELKKATFTVDYSYGSEIWTDFVAVVDTFSGGKRRARRNMIKGKDTLKEKMAKKAYGEIRISKGGAGGVTMVLPPVKNPQAFVDILKKVAKGITSTDSQVSFDQAMEILERQAAAENKKKRAEALKRRSKKKKK